jgi:glycosyltransferase involved in cell wall biosynthesis
MNRGGVETWLMHVLRHIDRARFQMDFLVHTTQPCAYDEEIRALGARILPCPTPSRPWRYARNFKAILAEHGPYDVVHSHVHHYSGYVLRLAHQAGVPVRIAHSHSDTTALHASANPLRRAYLSYMKRLIRLHAELGLAASEQAARALFGSGWRNDPRWNVFHCGIDLDPFKIMHDRKSVREELGIPEDAFVVGHVGRFIQVKNHDFLLQIARVLANRDARIHLLLVGDGPLRMAVEQAAAQLDLTERIVFTGVRDDVPRLLTAMDVFVMPSLYEGLPLVGIEVQAAGLPYVVSDTVTAEIGIIPQLVSHVSLTLSPDPWADVILATYQRALTVSKAAAWAIVKQSTFDIHCNTKRLEDIYKC